MDTSVLVGLANRIAAYFAAYPEEEAVAETANHILQFWDPRMRRDVIALAAAGGEGLMPIAKSAVARLAENTGNGESDSVR